LQKIVYIDAFAMTFLLSLRAEGAISLGREYSEKSMVVLK